MKICVFGLWHLGCVTAACIAEHFPTIGLDPNPAIIADLENNKAPLFEPGLSELLRTVKSQGKLHFTRDAQHAVQSSDVIWITFDTPVNDDDEAEFGFVEGHICSLFPYLHDGCIVLISSQMPVGFTARIEAAYQRKYPEKDVQFAYSPENLRLGKAIEVFRNPGRIVIGVRNGHRERLERLLNPLCPDLVWMSPESAEMTKHALNAFLANSITFINEVASICEKVGADAQQVEQGLKTDERIGSRAYLRAGGSFSGGTLARDVSFLAATAEHSSVSVPLLRSIRESNRIHGNWPLQKLQSLLGTLEGKTISVLGLTYKPNTDTLRRSAAIELCHRLLDSKAIIRAFDPIVKSLPDDLRKRIQICGSAIEAVEGSDAAVIATEWEAFRGLSAQNLIATMRTPLVLDANRFLEKSLGAAPPLQYVAVGRFRGSV